MQSLIDQHSSREITFLNQESFDKAIKLPFGAYDIGYKNLFFRFDNAKECEDFTHVLMANNIHGYTVM